MDYQRTQVLQEQEEFTTRHQANRDDALADCRDIAEKLSQLIEFKITREMARDVVEVNEVEQVSKGITSLRELALFTYRDPEDDENYFEYNFTEEINEFLKDLGLEG
jgi:hypothetical protein